MGIGTFPGGPVQIVQPIQEPTTLLKVYTPFADDDVVMNMSRRITSAMWTGNTGSLDFNGITKLGGAEIFNSSSQGRYISSAQSSSTGDWYYNIYNSDPNVTSSAEVQFAIAYGHKRGGGYPKVSVLNTAKEPTRAIYAQYTNLLLDPEDEKFTFGANITTDHFFAINIQRSRLKQKMDPGNWELVLVSGSGAGLTTVTLIDDSVDSTDKLVSSAGRRYDIVSGSLNIGGTSTIHKTAALETGSGGYGLFYPDRGFIILNPNALTQHLGVAFATSSASVTISDNKYKLYEMIVKGGISGSGFTARNEEIVTSTHYFVRVKNKDYNFSNNPTFYTSSDGTLKIPTFIGDPKVYITTVGLYNDGNELLAVGKLSQPILKSFDREALIKCKLDY